MYIYLYLHYFYYHMQLQAIQVVFHYRQFYSQNFPLSKLYFNNQRTFLPQERENVQTSRNKRLGVIKKEDALLTDR